MGYPTKDAPASGLPPGVQISFRDGLGGEDRAIAERAVATLIARRVQAVDRTRATEARRLELAEALNAPLAKLIADDPAAARALDELNALELDDDGAIDQLRSQPAPRPIGDALSIDLRSARDAVEVRVPPYDFGWSWHHQAGSAPVGSYFRSDGAVGLDARSGSIAGGAGGFVDAHVGFGLSLRTDHQVNVTGRSLRRMRHSYTVGCTGVGGSATSEGGMEFTAMENGQFLTAASAKLWRKRVSGLESAAHGEGPYAIYEPSELAFTMRPGRQYTFNVGIWAFADRSPGAGIAWAQSLIEGDVLALTIQRG
jgi:hypothetical protein